MVVEFKISFLVFMSFKKEILTIAVCCTIIFVGCGKKADENAEISKASELTTESVKNKVTKDIFENSETEENTIQETSIPDAYIPVLDGVYSLINDFDGNNNAENPYDLTGIDELIYPADNPKDCLNTVGYELKDINNDDTDELFIADKDNIYAIYTVKNDKAVLVTEGWIRNRNYLLNDNTIFNEGSGGAINNMFGTYRLNSGATELEPLDIYYSDFIDESNQTVGWFYSKGSDEYNDGSLTGMTLDDATKLCDEYLAEKADLNLIYLINYIPSN